MNTQKSTIKGLEQGRAQFAYLAVTSQKDTAVEGDYKAYAKKIPMLIKTNGLGATIAYIEAKGKTKKAYMEIYKQIAQWLKKDDKSLVDLSQTNLTEAIISLDSSAYRAVTVEILALFSWLSRFSEGLLEGGADDEA